MKEEWKIKGGLLQELNTLRSRILQLEQYQQKITEEISSEFEETFRSTFNNITEGVLLTNPENGKCITCNKVICELLGMDMVEITNLEIKDIYLQEDLDHVKTQLEKQRNGESTISKAVLIKRKDGEIVQADIASVPFTLADKRCVMNVIREIPPRKFETKMKLNTSTNFDEIQHLTAVEIRILKLIIRGMTSKEIAQLLHRSTRTIENHRAHLMSKLGVDNSVALMRKAISIGLVELSKEQQKEKSADL